MTTNPPKKQRGRPPTLSREQILDVALDIPFEQLSMVLVAKKLRVSDAALYYYFPTADSLRRGVVGHWSKNFKLPRRTRDWKKWVRAFTLSVFQFLITHPGTAAYMMAAGPVGANQYRIIEKALGVLIAAGFSVEHAWMLYSGVISLAIEHAQKRDEWVKIQQEAAGKPPTHFPEGLREFSEEDFPLTRQAAAFQAQLPLDAHFYFELEALLALSEKQDVIPFVSAK